MRGDGARRAVMEATANPFTFEHELLQALGTPVTVVDVDGAVRWFNQAAEEQHGWDLARDAGRLVSDLVPSLRLFGSAELVADMAARGRWSGRVLLTRSDGATYPALLTCVPVRGETGTFVLATSSDLSEFEEAERRFSSGFEHSPYGWVFSELDGTIVACNPAYAEIVGLERSQVIGRRPDDFTHPEDLGKRTPFESMRSGSHPPVFTVQKRYLRQDGSVRWVRVHSELVTDHVGRPEFFSGHVEDISELFESLAAQESVERSYRELFGRVVHSLGAALEVRDPYTAGHQHRVADLCGTIAHQLGLSDDETEGLVVCAEMHDIGKVATPAEILTKPGRLLDAEYEIIKLHPITGYNILRKIPFPWPVARAVREHHERLDGSGYPDGLTGDAICLQARVLGVADTVETVASDRPYRSARPLETALEIIAAEAGTLFDPDVVTACTSVFDDGYAFPHQATWPLHGIPSGADLRI